MKSKQQSADSSNKLLFESSSRITSTIKSSSGVSGPSISSNFTSRVLNSTVKVNNNNNNDADRYRSLASYNSVLNQQNRKETTSSGILDASRKLTKYSAGGEITITQASKETNTMGRYAIGKRNYGNSSIKTVAQSLGSSP